MNYNNDNKYIIESYAYNILEVKDEELKNSLIEIDAQDWSNERNISYDDAMQELKGITKEELKKIYDDFLKKQDKEFLFFANTINKEM